MADLLVKTPISRTISNNIMYEANSILYNPTSLSSGGMLVKDMDLLSLKTHPKSAPQKGSLRKNGCPKGISEGCRGGSPCYHSADIRILRNESRERRLLSMSGSLLISDENRNLLDVAM